MSGDGPNLPKHAQESLCVSRNRPIWIRLGACCCCCIFLLLWCAQPAVWQSIKQRLGPGGRVMVNLGHPPGMAGTAAHAGRTLAALDALAEAFEGEQTKPPLWCKDMLVLCHTSYV